MKILITNCTRNSGLSVLRALNRSGWAVTGADDRLLPLGLRSRFSAAPYHRLPAQDSPSFAQALLELIDKVRPDVLLPTRGIESACHARDMIAQRVRSLLPSVESFEALNDKATLLTECASLGIAIPRVFSLEDAVSTLRAEPNTMLVVKPRRDVGGGQGVHFVQTTADLKNAYANIGAQYGGALITDYIPGPVDNLRSLHLLFDVESRLIAFFVHRKLRVWPAKVGVTVCAVSTHEVELVRALLPLFERLRWQGPAEAELKIDERDGIARVLEINPRFSGSIHFPIASGVDFATSYARAALGERLESSLVPRYRAGVGYVDRGPWLAAALHELRREKGRVATLRRLRQELRAPQVPSVHSFGDPGPLLGKALMLLPAFAMRSRNA